MTVTDQVATSALASAFTMLLQAFRRGPSECDDLFALIDQHLAEGGSPALLLKILRDGAEVNPLPRDAHEALLNRITNSTLTRELRAPHLADAPTLALDDDRSGPRLAAPVRVVRAPSAGDILKSRFQLVELIGE